MEITEVRIKLMEDSSDRLKAFCSITFDDCFVIRDLKIIEGTNGPFVAMPSRKLTSHCSDCGCKNHLRAGFCNQCGRRLAEGRAARDEEGRAKLYADIAHPINSECREMIQDRVIEGFEEELERAKQPGYMSRYDEFDYDAPEPHFDTAREVTNAGKTSSRSSATRVEQPDSKRQGPHRGQKQTENNGPGTHRTAPDSFGDGIF